MFRRILLSFLLLAGASVPVLAGDSSEEFSVEVDKARVLHLPHVASTVIIGNPAIADAAVQNGRLLFVTGKTFGVTNLIALDARGNTIARRDIRVIAPQSASITYYRGGSQRTYSCAHDCELSPRVGNDPDVFDQLLNQQKDKADQGNSSAGSN